MIKTIVNNPDLKDYTQEFEDGQIIFLEGDDSQDLFILINGQLDILKGKKKIAEITKPGDLFGEMSFLLGDRRTATVKARRKGELVRIPKEEISVFLQKFPDMARTVTRLLARRLDETSQILFGLTEFCDQIPDAVILTNREGKILTMNAVAEKMYGRTWSQMHYQSAEEIYEEPAEYRNYLHEVQTKYSVREKILRIRHPERGTRFISTSITVLYDGQHNFQGVLFLGRDITTFKEMEKRYRRIRNRIVPSLILLCLIALGIFVVFPYYSRTPETVMDERKQVIRKQMGNDFLLLKSLLLEPLHNGDRKKADELMKDFFDVQEAGDIPYTGLVILDENLKVFGAYTRTAGEQEAKNVIGTSYSGIAFQGSENSYHRILTLYRADKEHPMGKKGTEVAFEMSKDGRLLGWLIFQMDMGYLKSNCGMDEVDLKKIHFDKPK